MQTQKSDRLWLAVGDIHDDPGNFAKIPELAGVDGIIISGDLTNTGGARQAEKIFSIIRQTGLPVFAQIGNMDRPEVNDWLNEIGVNLHRHVRELGNEVAIFGIGGSTFTPFSTPSEFPESAFATWLDEMWPAARKFPHAILVSHTPPKNTRCDDIGKNMHVGSEAVREFIEERQPDLCICGHIHEGRAIDQLGKTVIVNPGQLNEGGYVVVRLKDGSLSAELCEVGD